MIKLQRGRLSADRGRIRLSARLLATAAVALPLGLSAQVAMAQDAAPAAASNEASAPADLQEVVVTGSRVSRSGFTTPTPTTVVSQQLIDSSAASGIANVLQSLPAFKADFSGANTGPRSTGTPGASFANLRSLGSFRTLTLIDGKRVVPTALTGQVDLNIVPGILIDRADVVTGGASAAYGSDAVAGVVNIMLKHNIDGVIGDISGGVSDHGDNGDVHIGLAVGKSFLDDRLHITVGGEFDKNKGVTTPYSRDWGRDEWGVMPNPAVTAANPKSPTNPANIIVPAYHPSNLALGGVVTSGPLRGLTFLGGGQTAQFQYGSPVGPSFMSGGQNYGLQYINTFLQAPLTRSNALLRVDFDATDNIQLWGEGAWARAHTVTRGGAPRFTSPLTIRIDNAYLPASTVAAMQAANVTTIAVGRTALDLGFSENDSLSQVTRLSGGAKGELGGGWSWDAYAQYGKTEYRGEINNTLYYPNYIASIDAVRAPGGQIVCRSTLTNPTNGCVPTSLFGPNASDPAAAAYFMGDNWFTYDYTQKVVAANVRGQPFSTWAGPVSVAFGAEHRDEKLSSAADARSIACNPANQLATCWYLTNNKPFSGRNKVTEGYVEAVTPLLADQPFAKSLDLDTAIRVTDYSLSGSVTTWKLGLNYAVNDSVRFRATRSRDIRAPNLQNLFSPGIVAIQPVINPATGASLTTPGVQTSNTDLKPERADTTTFGVVFRPSFVPGLQASVDYYKIELKDAINALASQSVVNSCYAGISELCQYITLSNGGVVRSNADFATNSITSVERRTLNIAELNTEGFDFEVRYTTPLDRFFSSASGDLTLQLYATYVQHIIVDDGTGAKVDRAGEVGDAGTNQYGVPKWRTTFLATYSNGPLSVTGAMRYIDGGKYNVLYTDADINDNSVKGQTMFDLSGQYDIVERDDGTNVQLYGVVQNLFDKDPPIAPTQVIGTNPAFYDMIGRTYKMGVKFSF